MSKKLTLFGLIESKEEDIIFTPWSVVHLLSGLAAQSIDIDFVLFSILHLLYEVKDYKQHINNRVINSFPNSVSDQALAMIGHLIPIPKTTQDNKMYIFLYLGSVGLMIFLKDEVG